MRENADFAFFVFPAHLLISVRHMTLSFLLLRSAFIEDMITIELRAQPRVRTENMKSFEFPTQMRLSHTRILQLDGHHQLIFNHCTPSAIRGFKRYVLRSTLSLNSWQIPSKETDGPTHISLQTLMNKTSFIRQSLMWTWWKFSDCFVSATKSPVFTLQIKEIILNYSQKDAVGTSGEVQKWAHSSVEKRLVEYAEMEYLISAQGLIVMFARSLPSPGPDSKQHHAIHM